MAKLRERLWYPPNTWTGTPHFEVRLYHKILDKWVLYTEHETETAAKAHAGRLIERGHKADQVKVFHAIFA